MFVFHINVKSSNLQLYLDSRFIVSRDMLNVATLHFDYILCKTQNRSVYAHQCVSVCGGGWGGVVRLQNDKYCNGKHQTINDCLIVEPIIIIRFSLHIERKEEKELGLYWKYCQNY